MNLVDSCGWLEHFSDGPGAEFNAPAVEDVERLIVPTICLYEVYRAMLRQRGEDAEIQAVAAMRQGAVVELDDSIALTAARLGHTLKLPMADSIAIFHIFIIIIYSCC